MTASIRKTWWPWLVSAFVILGCAKEQSAEERRREINEREVARLGVAEGEFGGFVRIDADHVVPMSLTNRVVRNPQVGSQQPQLRSELRIGLFGGVTLSTSQTTFDFGNRTFVAAFGASSAGGSGDAKALAGRPGGGVLELRALIASDGALTEVELDATSGRYPVELSTSSTSSLFLTGAATSLIIEDQPDEESFAILNIQSSDEDLPAPEGFDLPLIANLRASLHIQGFAQTPQVASRVAYDPFRGRLEVYLSDHSFMIMENVFGIRSGSENFDVADRVHGQLFVGASEAMTFTAHRLTKPVDLVKLPPNGFVGSFQGPPNTPKWNAMAYVDYLERTGTNRADMPFRHFPVLRLTLYICSGDQQQSRQEFDLHSVDFAQGIMLWRNTRQQSREFVTWYTRDWQSLAGILIDPQSSQTIQRSEAPFDLRAEQRLGLDGCRYFRAASL